LQSENGRFWWCGQNWLIVVSLAPCFFLQQLFMVVLDIWLSFAICNYHCWVCCDHICPTWTKKTKQFHWSKQQKADAWQIGGKNWDILPSCQVRRSEWQEGAISHPVAKGIIRSCALWKCKLWFKKWPKNLVWTGPQYQPYMYYKDE
jgi:hypothetical protein